MERIKTIIENLSPNFQVTFLNEKRNYIVVHQLKKKSTQILKFHPSRSYLVIEDNTSLKMKRIHIFTNRENKHFLAFKYTNPIDFQIWVKEYTDVTISAIKFNKFAAELTYLNDYDNRIYPLTLPITTYYCLYCLENGIISTVGSVTFNNNFH